MASFIFPIIYIMTTLKALSVKYDIWPQGVLVPSVLWTMDHYFSISLQLETGYYNIIAKVDAGHPSLGLVIVICLLMCLNCGLF